MTSVWYLVVLSPIKPVFNWPSPISIVLLLVRALFFHTGDFLLLTNKAQSVSIKIKVFFSLKNPSGN